MRSSHRAEVVEGECLVDIVDDGLHRDNLPHNDEYQYSKYLLGCNKYRFIADLSYSNEKSRYTLRLHY